MRRREKFLKVCAFGIIGILLGFAIGCGGGGGGGVVSSSGVSGTASKGPVTGGTIEVYALEADGPVGALLETAETDAQGRYAVDIGAYTGNVYITLAGGTYRDEATGTIVPLLGTLHAVVTGVADSVSIAVTPLTELAYQLAGTPLTTDAINGANATVCSLVGINTINVQPSDATITDTTLTQAQIDYSLMLAALSQYAADTGKTIAQVIADILADLADGTLDTTGAGLKTALETFIAGGFNATGVADSSQTGLANNLVYYTSNTLNPGNGTVSDLWKAKALVSDFRETVMDVYNYKKIGVEGIVESPIRDLSEEIRCTLVPELSETVQRMAWIIQSAIATGGDGTVTSGDLTLTFTPSGEGTIYSFTDVRADATVVDTGILTLGNASLPTTGTFTGTMATLNGTLNVGMSYDISFNILTQSLSSLTLEGTMESAPADNPGELPMELPPAGPARLSVDGSITVNFNDNGPFSLSDLTSILSSIEPNRVRINGTVETGTMHATGNIDTRLVKNPSVELEVSGYSFMFVPSSFSMTTTLEALVDGEPTGTEFTGSVTGTWTNAATFDFQSPVGDANFPQWDISFNGAIQATGRPSITTFLRARQNSASVILLDANYRRTNSDQTVVFLSGTGTFDIATKLLTVELTNQNSMQVDFTYDPAAALDGRFTGTITTQGGEQMATLLTVGGIPKVQYADGFMEPVF